MLNTYSPILRLHFRKQKLARDLSIDANAMFLWVFFVLFFFVLFFF